MATFLADLWESIFTPGPTPTILIAANASFGVLQLLFLALLVATHSIHFVILSVLSGGLWWGINWFANELKQAQAKEEEAKRLRARDQGKEKTDYASKAKAGRSGGGGGVYIEGDAMDSGDDTEIDDGDKGKVPAVTVATGGHEGGAEVQAQVAGLRPQGASTTGLRPGNDEAMRKRRSMAESDASISTDSEWEKVEGEDR